MLKISLFRHWVSGLAQEARGSCSPQAHAPTGIASCPLVRALRAGLALLWVPMWLLLWGPRLVCEAVLDSARTLGLALQRLGAGTWLGLSVDTWGQLFLSCLHSLMLAALLLLLLTWRLFQKAHRFSLGWLPSQVGGLGRGLGCRGRARGSGCGQGWDGASRQPVHLGPPACLPQALVENCAVLELRRLYRWVESTVALTSWHLAYLVTWTTCLASYLLQAAFEHTAQLAEAQGAEPQEAPGPLPESKLHEPSTRKAGPVLPEPGAPGE